MASLGTLGSNSFGAGAAALSMPAVLACCPGLQKPPWFWWWPLYWQRFAAPVWCSGE